MANTKPFTITIEGIVGAGKTKLINYLKEQEVLKGVIFVEERVSEWENFEESNLIKSFYENPKRWGFTFQNCALMSMLQRQLESENAQIRIMERSPESSIKIFSETMFKSGFISKVEKCVLRKWFELIKSSNALNLDIDAHIYVKTSIPIAMDRINFRNRAGESCLTENYAQIMDSKHENWLLQQDKTEKDLSMQAKILIIDGDKLGKDILEEYEGVIAWILQRKIERDGIWIN